VVGLALLSCGAVDAALGGRIRAALRNDLGEGNLEGRGAAHTMGEGLVFEVRVPQDLPEKAQIFFFFFFFLNKMGCI